MENLALPQVEKHDLLVADDGVGLADEDQVGGLGLVAGLHGDGLAYQIIKLRSWMSLRSAATKMEAGTAKVWRLKANILARLGAVKIGW